MTIPQDMTVGQMVAEDYRAAQVFKNHGIDFCCKGNRSIVEVCEKAGLQTDQVLQEIETAKQATTGSTVDFKSWPLDLLIDYIEKKHHRYVEEQIPVINQYLDKVCKVHGKQNPELLKIDEQFKAASQELAAHMKKEELVLFPFVRKLVAAMAGQNSLEKPHFGTVQNPVNMMMEEHDTEGERFRKIAEWSNNYTPPEHACNTYRVTYALLKEFEDDLHAHIHLENNILFRKAIELENRL